ncbi:MAG: aldo/keto reductase [Clostridia bacterium]|nr:aldo/keto reductase [Clostridia bacterium]
MKSIKDSFILNNGVHLPCVGFGTYKAEEGQNTVDAIVCALQNGYRHIDTATFYKNEVSVGKAIKQSGIDRKEIFVTTKLWTNERGYKQAKQALEESLNRLELDYIDMQLIHWPASPNKQDDWIIVNLATWQAMQEGVEQGKIRAIGVSNFMKHHLQALVKSDVIPAVNQIEYHPGHMQSETVEFCKKYGVLIQAWSPMARGRLNDHPLLNDIAKKHNVSVQQVCLRWCLQNGVNPLPKSVTPSRIKQNADLFSFVLSDDEMTAINNMPPCAAGGRHPDEVDF